VPHPNFFGQTCPAKSSLLHIISVTYVSLRPRWHISDGENSLRRHRYEMLRLQPMFLVSHCAIGACWQDEDGLI
jgi:hypothetical protein